MINVSQDTEALRALTEEKCIALLKANSFGRLALYLDDGPTVVPVNYAFVDDTIVIRTAPGAKLTFAPMTMVAFEVDSVDPYHTWGWSVVARGPAFDITTAVDEHSAHLRQLPFSSWIDSNEKTHVLKIHVRELTGRRFGPETESSETIFVSTRH